MIVVGGKTLLLKPEQRESVALVFFLDFVSFQKNVFNVAAFIVFIYKNPLHVAFLVAVSYLLAQRRPVHYRPVLHRPVRIIRLDVETGIQIRNTIIHDAGLAFRNKAHHVSLALAVLIP